MPVTGSGVQFDTDNGIATILLDRPEAGNAIDMSVAEGLLSAALRCDTDDTIRCVIIMGAGKMFCAGGDIPAMTKAHNRSAYLSELAGRLHMAVSRFMRMEKPLVTLINGPAAGAGMSLAISGDVVLASRSATFISAYAGVGLTPDGGMSWMLPRLVGMREAQRILLLGEKITAARAESIGLITSVVDDDALMRDGMAVANRLAAGPTKSLGGARALLLASHESSLEGHLELEARRIAAAGAGPESAEGLAAFIDRRKPSYA